MLVIVMVTPFDVVLDDVVKQIADEELVVGPARRDEIGGFEHAPDPVGVFVEAGEDPVLYEHPPAAELAGALIFEQARDTVVHRQSPSDAGPSRRWS